MSQPAEWASHRAVWSAWPAHPEEWGSDLVAVQEEVAEFFRVVAHEGRGERLCILVRDAAHRETAQQALRGLNVELLVDAPYGDIWLRDTGPIFLVDNDGLIAAARFRFNGWGEKYCLQGDSEVSGFLADRSSCRSLAFDWVLEGGSVDTDGQGTVLTTEQCLLNPNRGAGRSKVRIESELRAALGAQKVLWLKEGLINDHTDGHIDTLARFVGPARVVCMHPSSERDPNRLRLEAIRAELEGMSDAIGRELSVVTVPSPGSVSDRNGVLMPASYVNFYISNSRVVVPTYGVPQDVEAVATLAEVFPGREVVGSSARALLTGGGAFHCITQQEPQPQTMKEDVFHGR